MPRNPHIHKPKSINSWITNFFTARKAWSQWPQKYKFSESTKSCKDISIHHYRYIQNIKGYTLNKRCTFVYWRDSFAYNIYLYLMKQFIMYIYISKIKITIVYTYDLLTVLWRVIHIIYSCNHLFVPRLRTLQMK